MNLLRKSEPLLLLIAFGLAFGSIISVSKYALSMGAQPLSLAFHQFLICGFVLFLWCLARGQAFRIDHARAKYFVVSGFLGIAAPHVLLFVVVQQLGAGMTSIAYIFPPLFTYFMALIVRMERFDTLRAIGLLIGFAGSFIIVLAPTSAQSSISVFWLMCLFLIPLSLSWGNIFRSKHWPKNLSDLQIAMGTLATSAVLLVAPAVAANGARTLFMQPDSVNLVTVAQAVLTGVAYLIFFRLQRVGGAVYLSQSGFIITGVGLLYGVSLFGERYSMEMWIGFLVSLLGVLIVSIQQLFHTTAKKTIAPES